jgi:AcrR family transcriptional regulator
MTKGDSVTTINKLLQVAEELFSEKGFNGTSVNMIAERAGVNKALIYYHFKDKDDIINSLFKKIIKESDESIGHSADLDPHQVKESSTLDAIRDEITFMQKKKKILGIMLMESLKGNDKYNYFFQCAEKIIKNESNGIFQIDDVNHAYSDEMQRYLVHEFFTGVIPFIAFIIFQDKWCDYYQCDSGKLMEFFLDSFKKTHLDAEIK